MKIEKAWKNHSRVKCDCGHYPKDHYSRSGACLKCGCTWYWPNVKYQNRKRKQNERINNERSRLEKTN